MQHEEFIEEVRKRADLTSTDEAERATRATLIVLGEYLSGGEGPDLAAQLPQGIAEYLKRQPPGRPEIFSLEDFLQRVAEEEDIDSESASTHARAVINKRTRRGSEPGRDGERPAAVSRRVRSPVRLSEKLPCRQPRPGSRYHGAS